MARFFISYARADAAQADALVRAIEYLGHEAWIDRDLVGGHKWWDEILENIRRADVFLTALSVEFVDSSACMAEYGYARALDKLVFPVLVSEVSPEVLPADLAAIQFIDYCSPGEHAALALAKAIAVLPKPRPLPTPLPLAPELVPARRLPPEGIVASANGFTSLLRGSVAALVWGLVIVLVIFPIALLSGAIVVAVAGLALGLDSAQISAGWTLAAAAVSGWFVWIYLSTRLKRGIASMVIWWRRRRAMLVSVKPRSS